MTELVFIGIDMSQVALAASLDTCLLDEWEMKMNWEELEEGFPEVRLELYV